MLRYGNEIYSEKQLRKTRPEKQRTKEERRAMRDVKRIREDGTSGWMSDWYRFRKEENK